MVGPGNGMIFAGKTSPRSFQTATRSISGATPPKASPQVPWSDFVTSRACSRDPVWRPIDPCTADPLGSEGHPFGRYPIQVVPLAR